MLRGFGQDFHVVVAIVLICRIYKLGYIVSGTIGFPAAPTPTRHHQTTAFLPPTTYFIMDPREVAIESAIRDYNARVYTSQAAAARAYGIPRSTLQDRLKGAINSTASY